MLNYKQIDSRISKYPMEEIVIYKYVSTEGKPVSYELFREIGGEMKRRLATITPSQVEYYTDKGHIVKTFNS